MEVIPASKRCEQRRVRQGDVYISDVSVLTGERELRVVLSCDLYNRNPGCLTVLVAEIETGTRLRSTQHGVETDYGLILADRIVWKPVDALGEAFGRITDEQRRTLIGASCSVIQGP